MSPLRIPALRAISEQSLKKPGGIFPFFGLAMQSAIATVNMGGFNRLLSQLKTLFNMIRDSSFRPTCLCPPLPLHFSRSVPLHKPASNDREIRGAANTPPPVVAPLPGAPGGRAGRFRHRPRGREGSPGRLRTASCAGRAKPPAKRSGIPCGRHRRVRSERRRCASPIWGWFGYSRIRSSRISTASLRRLSLACSEATRMRARM
jgi:hypothetical protein